MKRHQLSTLLLAGCLPLAACGGTPADDVAREAERAEKAVSVLGIEREEIEREVREGLATENIDFGGDHHLGTDEKSTSDAEITPEGDLLVDGKRIEVDAEERALLLAYRKQISEVALAGARIGVQGAALAKTAMGEAFRGVLSGNTDDIEAKIEAEADKIRVQASELCAHLGPLLETQDALAASIPELQPYATMDQGDIDQCVEDAAEGHVAMDTATH